MAHQFYFNPYILDNLPAPQSGFDVVQDLSDPRLRMYITSRGVKTFFVRKRVNGKDRRIIIGGYPETDIEDARSSVQAILDNAMQKPVTRRRKIVFEKFIKLYLEKCVRRGEDSRVKLERAINRHLVPLFGKNVSEISSDDIRSVIDAIDGPAIAGRMQELLHSVFKFALENGYVKKNPVSDIPRVRQNRRVRPLTRAGLVRLIDAIGQETDMNMQAAFYMLIYGFVPKSKVFAMQWEDLDFNHDLWDSRPLSDRAIVLLQDLPQSSNWVFPGRGGFHIIDPRVAWARVAQRAGIPNLTMDDVYKFLMRQLTWATDRADLRDNMNALLDNLLDVR